MVSKCVDKDTRIFPEIIEINVDKQNIDQKEKKTKNKQNINMTIHTNPRMDNLQTHNHNNINIQYSRA